MDRLLLFQLSDLHFGSSFEGTEHAKTGLQSGLNGHDLKISQNLATSLERAREDLFEIGENDAVKYLIGGDLTRTGSKFDFQLVNTYSLFRTRVVARSSWNNDPDARPQT